MTLAVDYYDQFRRDVTSGNGDMYNMLSNGIFLSVLFHVPLLLLYSFPGRSFLGDLSRIKLEYLIDSVLLVCRDV
jgi:hypothetical protein